MTSLNREKVAAIVPALNEEANVGNVLKVLLNSKYLDEIILVDDGSTDKTAEVAEKLGAKVVKLPKNTGKGNAILCGTKAISAEIIVFFDADLVGLNEQHIFSLVSPVLSGQVDMCVGVREHAVNTKKFGPLMALGGERAIKKCLLEKIPKESMQGFAVETAINYYFLKEKLNVKYVDLKGLSIIIKEKKWGFTKGFANRLKMIFEIIKIRLQLCIKKQL